MNFWKIDFSALKSSQWEVIKCRAAANLWVGEGASWSVTSRAPWPSVAGGRMNSCTQIWASQVVDQKQNINSLLYHRWHYQSSDLSEASCGMHGRCSLLPFIIVPTWWDTGGALCFWLDPHLVCVLLSFPPCVLPSVHFLGFRKFSPKLSAPLTSYLVYMTS